MSKVMKKIVPRSAKLQQSRKPLNEESSAVNLEWEHVDAQGQVLGRLATAVAAKLLGKHRIDYAPHVVAPVYMVVTNTDLVVLTGQKEQQKKYRHHTGYPGHLKERSVAEQRQRDSRQLVYRAVSGMLPKNSLRARRLAHLKLYCKDEHPHQAQLTKNL